MPEYVLMPRLHRLGVQRLLEEQDLLRSGTLEDRLESVAPFMTHGSSGGSRARRDQLGELRACIITIAEENGFPSRGSVRSRAAFDARSAQWLAQKSPIQGGEALRDDVWAFVACCVAPDVVLWRFEGAHPDRFHGGIRNTYQRLWLRGHLLDRGDKAEARWGLLDALTEDALVQITERPGISADGRIAIAIAEAWVETAGDFGVERMQGWTRRAVKKVHLENELINLSSLDPDTLRQVIQQRFASEATSSQSNHSSRVVSGFGTASSRQSEAKD